MPQTLFRAVPTGGSALALLLGAVVLAGCGAASNAGDTVTATARSVGSAATDVGTRAGTALGRAIGAVPAPRPVLPTLYCYETLADPVCFREPQPERAARLISFYDERFSPFVIPQPVPRRPASAGVAPVQTSPVPPSPTTPPRPAATPGPVEVVPMPTSAAPQAIHPPEATPNLDLDLSALPGG